jgi:hypothetical protein
MAENNVRVRADLNPDAIDNADHDDQDPPPPPQNDHDGVVPVPPAAPGAAQTTLAFKVEQSKIPEYFGQKGKDNITAIVFIRKIEDLARTNRWNDTTTYANVANNLKGFARDWLFAKFGIPAQIHTDRGKDFVNKLSAELFQLLNVRHTKTSLAHPQCNAQVEVFNKTVKKFLQSFVDDTTLNWETFLPALAISYNTSYHSTISMTPFELLFGEKARLPSFPNEDIQQLHYGETSAAERFNLLQKLRAKAHQSATEQGLKSKNTFDKNTVPHKFKISDKVLISNDFYVGKNPKLAPTYTGPGEIIVINDTNAKVRLNNKIKILNVNKLKLFLQEHESDQNQTFLDYNFSDSSSDKPLTRAGAKLINYKNAAQLALLMLKEEGGSSDFGSSDSETIDSLCSEPCPSCDTENEYFKLNPPKRNFTQKCNNCEEFKKALS